MVKEEIVPTTIYLRKDQHEFLKKHPEISLSAFVRKQLDKFIAEYKKLEESIETTG